MKYCLKSKKFGLICIYLWLLVVSCHTLSYAMFEEIGPAVRAMGMGNSFVAVEKDANTVFYNPAGLAKLKTRQVSLTYAQLAAGIGGIGDNVVAVAMPIGKSGIVVGGSWLSRSVTGWYAEDSYGVSVAKIMSPKIAVGASVKMLKLSYQGDDVTNNPFFADKTSVSGFAVDAGLVTELQPRLVVGLSIKNGNQPNVAIGEDGDKVPMMIRVGGCYDFGEKNPGLISAEILNPQKDMELNAGIEKVIINNRIKVRGGINYLMSSSGQSASMNLSIGAGIQIQKILIDYAYTFNVGDFKAYQNHRFGVGIEF